MSTPSAALAATSRAHALADAFDGALVVPLARVLALADPRTGDPWGIGTFTDEDVRAHDELTDAHDPVRRAHLERVAHFVRAGVDPADAHPIVLDVGFGGYRPAWPVVDGNHRLAAAAVSALELVAVDVVGDWDEAVNCLIDGAQQHCG